MAEATAPNSLGIRHEENSKSETKECGTAVSAVVRITGETPVPLSQHIFFELEMQQLNRI